MSQSTTFTTTATEAESYGNSGYSDLAVQRAEKVKRAERVKRAGRQECGESQEGVGKPRPYGSANPSHAVTFSG